MDRYTKGFVIASLVYFFLAAVLGIWMGAAASPAWVSFAHIHFNLLGFMAMMIYGVGYFILPRFNARTLKWPQWVSIHFYAANLGLIGMVATASETDSAGFILFALLNVISVAMFALNLGVTLLEPQQVEEQLPAGEVTPEHEIYVTPDTRMGEIITRWPESVDILVSNGFTPLKDPDHLEKVKSLPVTLGMACERHGLDSSLMVSLLNQAASALEKEKKQPGPGGLTSVRGRIGPGEKITSRHVIGDILKAYPATEKVFRKYYGAACFSCPGQATESIRQSALMHNVDEQKILKDLNEVAGT
ncbi:MAG: DUF1858 domain-containing protein [Desulfobulbaceae bacterium]|nr:DUF1858 domain-containing protein [Desulfobulbaceae bacterium]